MRLSERQRCLLLNAELHGVIRKRTTFSDYGRTFDQLEKRGLLELFEIDKYRLTQAGREAISKTTV